MEGEAKSGRSAAIIALVGGLLMAVGSLMAWAKVSIHLPSIGMDESVSVAGTKGDGTITVILGAAIVILAIVAAMKSGGKVIGWIITACAVVGTGIGVWDWSDIKSKGNDVVHGAVAAANGNADVAKMLQDAIKVGAAVGLYLVLVGGIVALIGGVMSVRTPAAAPAAAQTPTALGTTPPVSPSEPPPPPPPPA